jgi:hypothetical protein
MRAPCPHEILPAIVDFHRMAALAQATQMFNKIAQIRIMRRPTTGLPQSPRTQINPQLVRRHKTPVEELLAAPTTPSQIELQAIGGMPAWVHLPANPPVAPESIGEG